MNGGIKNMETKTIQIGRVDGNLKTITLGETETISDALRQAGLNITETERIISDTADSIDTGEIPSDSGIYYIASNEVLGIKQ